MASLPGVMEGGGRNDLMISRKMLGLMGLAIVVGCGGGTVVSPETETPPEAPEPPPRGEPVVLLDLIPASTSGAALVDVERLRQSANGVSIISLLRRLGAASWEQQLGVDLDGDVNRVVAFGESIVPGQARDLDGIGLNRETAFRGAVIELSTANTPPERLCHEADLEQVQAEPLETQAGPMNLGRCGQYLLLSCCDRPLPSATARSDAAIALERLMEESPTEIPAMLWLVVGPDLVDRSTCEQSVIELTGWHTLAVGLDRTLDARARIRAATPEGAPELEQCLADGVAMLATLPFLAQMGLGGIVDRIEVGRDPNEQKDVLVSLTLPPDQVEALMGLFSVMGNNEATP